MTREQAEAFVRSVLVSGNVLVARDVYEALVRATAGPDSSPQNAPFLRLYGVTFEVSDVSWYTERTVGPRRVSY